MSNENSLNEKELAAVDRKVTTVETALKRLDELQWAHGSISDKINKAKADETDALDGTLSEDKAVAALIQARSLKDVHGARLADVANKIAAQTVVVLAAGRTARTYATTVVQLLAQYRLSVAVVHIKENFANQTLGTPEHLARHDKKFQAAEALASGFAPYHDAANDIASLRQLRSHFEPVVEAVNSEAEFKLSLPESWLE